LDRGTHKEAYLMSIIDSNRERTVDKILSAALLPVRVLLPRSEVDACCAQLHHDWRDRVFNPMVTLLICIWKHLQPGLVSVRAAEDYAASLAEVSSSPGVRDGKDFCKARARLPEAVFKWASQHVGSLAHQAAAHVYRGLTTVLVDGTTLRTANTPALEKRFGRSRNAVRASRSPLMRMVLLVCAGCGAVLNTSIGAYADSEHALVMPLLMRLPGNLLVIADAGYASFVLLSFIRWRQSHFVVRVSSRILKIKKQTLGYHDDLREWKRPARSQSAWPMLLPLLSATMDVRVIERQIVRAGYRTWTLRIATSLLDPVKYPADDLVELYLRRWRIEIGLRTLKTHGHMARLTGKTPDIALKEVHCSVLAYNCVCALMAQSGEAPELLSAKRAREIALMYAGHMAFAPTVKLPALFQEMLRMIATALQLPQERGPDPRAIIQRPSTFPVLMTSRKDWKSKQRMA
jgi:putative transposase